MFFCGMVDNLPRWPWENKRYSSRRPPRLRQVHTRMSGAFFHTGISRFQAEMFLTRAAEDGSFLVRDSESMPGAYVLCLMLQGKVHQYRVLPGPDGKLHVQSETGTIMRGYGDLTELIGDYIAKGDQNGLACALVHPIPPVEQSPEELDLTDDDDDDDDDFEDVQNITPPYDMRTGQVKENVDLLRKFSQLDLSGCDGAFTVALKDYVDHGYQKDSVSLNVGDSVLHEFTKLLELSTQGLKKELDAFSHKMDVLDEFLRIGDRRQSQRDSKRNLTGPGLPTLMEQMTRVRCDILHLQTKAQETIQIASMSSEYEYLGATSLGESVGEGFNCGSFLKSAQETIQIASMPSEYEYLGANSLGESVGGEGGEGLNCGSFLKSVYRPCIPQSKFEVKKFRNGRTTKLQLTVDVQTGKYSILKPTSKDTLDQNTISHDRILHLIKATKDKCSLDIVLEGKNKQTYIFESPQVRENFCLQIRQMKNMHSTDTDIDQISIFIGTWNMGDSNPNQSLSTWLKCVGKGKCRDRVLGAIPHDMYVIGTQESSMTEKDWVNTLKAGLKACVMVDVELVDVCTLWGIRLAVLIKPEYKNYISRTQNASVRTGIANALGNKGAVAISFYFNGTSFCFINTHLTSGQERCNRRNQNYRDIVKHLTMSLGQKHLSLFDVTNQFHHVFWLGDLNYRVEEDVHKLLIKVKENDIGYLMERDQLKMEQKKKTAFCGFQEADITFLPTYRLERNMPGYKYAWKKAKATGDRINAPSWCDRVMWRSYPGSFLESVAYGCSEQILSSDHRPVFSSFNVGISSEFLQNRDSLHEVAAFQIIFHSIEAQVKTCCKQYFQLVFHSTCLQEMYTSCPNSSFQENRTGFYTVPVWQGTDIEVMRPLFGDQDFLEDQHILIAVICKVSDNESYGECVLSLKDMFSSQPQEFEYTLQHQGEETGIIKGKMHVKSKHQYPHRSSSKKSYSLIAFDTEYHDPEVFVSDKPILLSSGGVIGARQDKATYINKANTVKVRPSQATGVVKPRLRQVMSSAGTAQDTSPGAVYETIDAVPFYESQLSPSKAESRGPPPLPLSSPSPTSPPYMQPPPRSKQPTMGQKGLLAAGSQRGGAATGYRGQQGTSPAPSEPPPPVPPKRGPSLMDHSSFRYDDLKRPTTVEEWLAQLNLSCYEHNFLSNGWESLLYIGEMTIADMININITVEDHQRKIMASIRELNKV